MCTWTLLLLLLQGLGHTRGMRTTQLHKSHHHQPLPEPAATPGAPTAIPSPPAKGHGTFLFKLPHKVLLATIWSVAEQRDVPSQ